ncbi:MAG TPA: efflux RND transporter permease subunit [Solirubrobacteraceae bacterium]|nr:efflux RND transporter permease subunit [Solirubrobacteraceae bacterium]
MNLTERSLKSPIGVAVGVGLIVVLGIVALVRLPVQLFPDIDEPVITIFTGWRAAAPAEVESELLEPQEQALRGLPGLKEIQSFANAGGAFINLQFAIGTDMGRTLIEVIARMNQLPPLPRDADPPRISLGQNGGQGPNETLSWFFVQLKPGTPGPIENYRHEVEELMRSRIESIPGVGTVNVNAGAPDELRITFDPYRAAELGIPIPAIVGVAGTADDVSGGFAELGRRQYTLRFAGRYRPDDLGELVLDWRDGRPVRLADVATISVERGDRNALAVQNNNPAIALQIIKESGADVLSTLNAVKEEIGRLREGPLADLGLAIEQSFDPSVFINQAIGLVAGNLVAGIILAVGVLWLFLRQFRSTLLVGVAIPVSVLATVLVMLVTGHSLNVISIAGIAFAVGMTLDAATIVLESILLRREQGVPPAQAALEGATRVWPALFASTLTTVIVFLPVIFLKSSEGQLFADLALTISVAIGVSLVMAVTVLPVAAARWLKPSEATAKAAEWPRRLGERMAALTDSPRQRQATIALCLVAPAVLTWALLPPIDYLPPVKRDAIDGFFQFPPGMNVDAIETEVVEPMVRRLEPYMSGEKEPRLKNYYILIFPGGGTIGVRPLDPSRIDELGRIVNEEITAGFPDLDVFAQQGNLFGGFGDGRNIEVRLQSADYDALLKSARAAQDVITEKMPGAQVRSFQDLELAEPELRLVPDDRRISESGWTRANVATVVRALGDGIWVGEHFDGDRRLDMILRASGWDSPDALAAVPVATPTGGVVPLGELVRIEPTVTSTGLRRVDGRRTIGINVVAPPGTSLQQAMQKLETDVGPAIAPLLPPDGGIRYAGDAGSLETALADMRVNISLALLVLFLLMAALFKSLRDSALVLLTVPLASLGGVLGIRFLNLFTPQTLDMLTMVGFIILLGAAVNNAILLVESARVAERRGMSRRDAVRHALEERTRPIFATSLGQLAGLLPMIIVPGPGAALYRGLGTVICGGMLLNTVFMLVLLPALLRLGEPAAEGSAAPAAGRALEEGA